jgi:hypothetical protein
LIESVLYQRWEELKVPAVITNATGEYWGRWMLSKTSCGDGGSDILSP